MRLYPSSFLCRIVAVESTGGAIFSEMRRAYPGWVGQLYFDVAVYHLLARPKLVHLFSNIVLLAVYHRVLLLIDGTWARPRKVS